MYGWGSDDSSSDTSSGSYDYSGARDAYVPPSSGGGYSRSSSASSSSGTSSGVGSGATPKRSAPADRAACHRKRIKTESAFPVLVRIDVTGSNKSNTEVFWEKLPLLFKEAERFCPGLSISFAAIGDATSEAGDNYPLQVRGFRSGAKLEAELAAIYPEGGGGDGICESYEVSAVYDLRCVQTPNARLPFLFLLCDEMPYPTVDPDQVREHVGVSIETTDTKSIYDQLKQKYNLYVLHSPYGSSSHDAQIVSAWRNYVGEERVLILEDPVRVVDAIIGVIAAHTGHIDDFKTRLTDRQTAPQVRSVMKTIMKVVATTSAAADPGKAGKSVMKTTDDKKTADGKKTGTGKKADKDTDGSDTRSKPLM